MSKTYYVYILSNRKNGTLYIGVTSNLKRRIQQHKEKKIIGFTEKHNIDKLIYYEHTNSIESALQREKQLKKWNRTWKISLVIKDNPDWEDLSLE
ncbi:GIY-YIG nuclease family protein [Candidatus Pacebacteria bacterium]|nr:GIY-YIG nuclease family protein [Candidatus Paceibacterota bacterium]